MADIIRTTKTDYKNKGIMITDGQFINQDGEVIDIVNELQRVFGDNMFDLSATRSEKEEIDISSEE